MRKEFKRDIASDTLIGYGDAYVIGSHKPDTLVGKTLTIIEGIGLSNKQEEAVKSMIKSTIYDTLLDRHEFIPGHLHDVIAQYNKWYQHNGYGVSGSLGDARVVNGVPSNYDYTLVVEKREEL